MDQGDGSRHSGPRFEDEAAQGAGDLGQRAGEQAGSGPGHDEGKEGLALRRLYDDRGPGRRLLRGAWSSNRLVELPGGVATRGWSAKSRMRKGLVSVLPGGRTARKFLARKSHRDEPLSVHLLDETHL